jgi:surface carbohydrate biosynthesis protein (TIGR04326 family)
MKLLLIFDENLNLKLLQRKIGILKPDSIFLFPLTSCWDIIYGVERICKMSPAGGTGFINSARLIDEEIDSLRGKVSAWSLNLGNLKVYEKSIKKWFLLPKEKMSTWWFTMLSEKNTFKTDVFLKIAQLNTIDRIISREGFDFCIFSVRNKTISAAIDKLCRRHLVDRTGISSTGQKPFFKKATGGIFNKISIINCVLEALWQLRINIARFIMAKFTMGPLKGRLRESRNKVLVVSYFPLVDNKWAEKGKLKNKYVAPLQEKILRMNKKIVWIWLYVFLEGKSFYDALRLAGRFSKNGEEGFFIDEFMSAKLLCKSLFLWLRQIWIFVKLRKGIPERILYENLSVPESETLIKNLMTESFTGRMALESILHFELFKKIFADFSEASHCIYCFEMQAWEKALNAAKVLKAPLVKTVAFQHTVAPKNCFHFLCNAEEAGKEGDLPLLPLPDILACNGDITLDIMREFGHRNIKKVEAIRHLYLASSLKNLSPRRKDKIVLVLGSVGKKETKALISLFFETFPKPAGFRVWLKGHPCLPVEEIMEELKIPVKNSGYSVKHDALSELLEAAQVALIGSSAAAIEALASDTRVILPVFADTMLINPLNGFERYYIKVSSPEELKGALYKSLENGNEINHETAKDFVLRYWNLDETLKRWEEVLR